MTSDISMRLIYLRRMLRMRSHRDSLRSRAGLLRHGHGAKRCPLRSNPTFPGRAMTQSTENPPVKRLWYTRCPAPTPFGIAIQQGWLQDEFRNDGIDIQALQDSSDPVIRQSHFTHSQAHSFRQGGNIPALWARAQGADTRVIGLSWVDEFQGLVALPSSGIEDPADLRTTLRPASQYPREGGRLSSRDRIARLCDAARRGGPHAGRRATGRSSDRSTWSRR